MSEPSNPVVVYSIGHSNLTADELIALLRNHRIRTVVDVRSMPYSRFVPQFNREALEHALACAGIEYRFAGDFLGGRPQDPSCYKNGQLPEGKANYLELVDYAAVATRDWYQRGLARLVDLATTAPTAVLCSEEDPDQCHRHHLIAQSLLERGLEVRHVRRDGTVEDARDPRFAAEPEQLSLFTGGTLG